ncbi:hypothetical protein [Dichotomicrobium thermohalophilum]|uniref:Uncharacterized protein n=1 Tax=Dichotomicrobium thermohalophilum TaxID=933063 RepID=A0A397Q4I9_9HYPH|nr:hypothetical protein [Dichotomicrobium thermohalophilum]RIA55958.1 hypothetical protein BXY53_1046 [Dichotomicrobium thermohalophilum]
MGEKNVLMGEVRVRSLLGAVSVAALCVGAPAAMAADLLDRDETAKGVYETPHQYFVGLSARGLYGHMEREGSDFFRELQLDGETAKVVDPNFVSFDNDEEFSGFEGEAFIGKRYGDYAIAFFVGGSVISSDVSDSGSIEAEDRDDSYYLHLEAPEADKSRAFEWVDTNQFDVNDYDYDNDYDRREIAFGIRPTFFFGNEPAPSMKDVSLKDAPMPVEGGLQHMLQPMVFATLGTVEVDEHFSGFTDNDPPNQLPNILTNVPGNIEFAYNNDIESDFTGIGFGMSVRGPIHGGGLKIGYFATAKATAEFHDASATADWSYEQIGESGFVVITCEGSLDPVPENCPKNIKNQSQAGSESSTAKLSEEKTVWTLHLEGGLTFGVTEGVNLELGGRYRRTEAPQVIIDGTQDAYIAFEEAEELGGFVGLTAQF